MHQVQIIFVIRSCGQRGETFQPWSSRSGLPRTTPHLTKKACRCRRLIPQRSKDRECSIGPWFNIAFRNECVLPYADSVFVLHLSGQGTAIGNAYEISREEERDGPERTSLITEAVSGREWNYYRAVAGLFLWKKPRTMRKAVFFQTAYPHSLFLPASLFCLMQKNLISRTLWTSGHIAWTSL